MVVLFCVLSAQMLICAFMAFRTPRLLISALWLAGCSAILSILLYLMGAYQVAVIELSVGAGLVTVLFVFAISIAGDEIDRGPLDHPQTDRYPDRPRLDRPPWLHDDFLAGFTASHR